MHSTILTLLIFIPVMGAVSIVAARSFRAKDSSHADSRLIALITTGVQLILSLWLYMSFDPTVSISESPFTVQVPWISSFNIEYFVGVDGLSMPMVLLTALLSFLCILCS